MNEDKAEQNAENQEEWQAPPIPEEIPVEEKEDPQMSEVATLSNIFFEPGKTFEDLRRKPRFIMAFVIIAIFASLFAFGFGQKMGEERFRRFFVEQIERNPAASGASEEQKSRQVGIQMTIVNVSRYLTPLLLLIFFAIGSLVYWLAAKAMGGTIGFMQAVSVWIYSSFPPTVVSAVANLLILFLKSADDIDIAASSRGLVNANPSLLFGDKEMPVLTTLISTIDLFAIWGLVLAAIGLQKVAKLSKGASWAIVLILTLLGITFRVVSAVVSGNPS